MTKIIYFGGQKGGSGKTTSSHLFCLGATLAHEPAGYALTDPGREPKPEGRPYTVLDCRDPKRLAQVVTISQAGGNGWLVIDGGGNRMTFDEEMARTCGLSVIPFKDDEEFIAPTAKDLGRMERSFALPAAWPTNAKAQESSRRFIEALDTAFPGRIIPSLSVFVHSTNELNGHDLANPSTPVRALAKKVFSVVSELYDQQHPALKDEAAE